VYLRLLSNSTPVTAGINLENNLSHTARRDGLVVTGRCAASTRFH
jgi:hypothetical protein